MKVWIEKLSRDKLARLMECYNERSIIYYDQNISFNAIVEEYVVNDNNKSMIDLYNNDMKFSIYFFEKEYILNYYGEESVLIIQLFDEVYLILYNIIYEDFVNDYYNIKNIKINNDLKKLEFKEKDIIKISALDMNDQWYINNKDIKLEISRINKGYIFNFLDEFYNVGRIEILKPYFKININAISLCSQVRQSIFNRVYLNEKNNLKIEGFNKQYLEVISYFYEEKIESEKCANKALISIKIDNKVNIHFDGTKNDLEYIKNYNYYMEEKLIQAAEEEREWWNSLSSECKEGYINMFEK